MSVKIECPHCKEEFEAWKDYANHVLKAHKEDKERCIWAKAALESGNTSPDPIVSEKMQPVKVKGKKNGISLWGKIFTSPTSPKGRRARIKRLIVLGHSEADALKIIYTKDYMAGRQFSDEETEVLLKLKLIAPRARAKRKGEAQKGEG